MIMIIYISLIAFKSVLNDCPKSTPLLYNDTCVLRFCRKNSYEQGICVVANEIVKIQWVTSVIFIDMPKAIVFFQKYKNGDLILELLAYKSNYIRKFYELKQNEEMLLVKDEEFATSFTLNSNYTSTYIGNLFIIKIGENEYPVFFGSYGFGIELYDLKEGKVYNYRNSIILDGNQYSNVFVSNFTLNNSNLYLLVYKDAQKLKLKICEFNSTILDNITPLIEITLDKKLTLNDIYITCFISDSNIIICMYLEESMCSENNNNDYTREIKIFILVYNEKLEE